MTKMGTQQNHGTWSLSDLLSLGELLAEKTFGGPSY